MQGEAQDRFVLLINNPQERVPMSTSFVRLISRLLVVCLIGLPFQVSAGMIGTDTVVSAAQAQAARATVLSQLSRADVAGQLQSLGLSQQNAQDRVAALTDAEVAKLAGQIQSLPAGADGAALVVLILIGVLIWWLVKK
ncbi:MAG: PA2779 family protein [Candidatus Parcubacteria bacterium]|nr:PA2779 family protein [Burkholderiales bacterium]